MYHAFVARMTEFLSRTQTATSHFRACTGLVQLDTVATLSRPRDLDQLPQLVRYVTTQVSRHSKAA